MHTKFLLTVLLVVSVSHLGITQSATWTLERCIRYAQENNLTIQHSTLSVKQSELTLENSQREYYPNVNGSVNYGFNVGRSIDPTSNTFVNNAIQTNGISVSAGTMLYSGGRIQNTIEQNKYNIQAAKKDLEQSRNINFKCF